MIILYTIIIIFTVFIIIRYSSPYIILNIWNFVINDEVKTQNIKYSTNGIPSFHFPSEQEHSWAKNFYQDLKDNYVDIKSEILDLNNNGYQGPAMIDMDHIQGNYFGNEAAGWKPMWIKLLGSYSNITNRLPTLYNIAKKYPNLMILHCSVMEPNTILKMHYGISQGLWRLHFGIDIPDGNTGLNLCGNTIKWAEGEGFMWDDTLLHAAWNLTNNKRLIIFADIPREFKSTWKTKLNIYIHHLIEYCKHTQTLQHKIKGL